MTNYQYLQSESKRFSNLSITKKLAKKKNSVFKFNVSCTQVKSLVFHLKLMKTSYTPNGLKFN